MNLRNILQRITRHGIFILTVLIIGIGVLLIWFITSGFSSSAAEATIGIAAISAFLAAVSSIANLLQAVETEKQRRNQERPYVSAYFDASSNSAIYFTVQNSGNAPAVKVKIKIDPTPIDFAGRKLNEVTFFSQPIGFLPAGKFVRQMVNIGHKFFEKEKTAIYEIEVEYFSTYGERFTEKLIHNLEYLRQTTVPGKTTEENLSELVKEIKEIKTEFIRIINFGAILSESPQEQAERLALLVRDKNDKAGWRYKLKKFLFGLVNHLYIF
jgi:hypothetical protein